MPVCIANEKGARGRPFLWLVAGFYLTVSNTARAWAWQNGGS